MEHIKVWHVDVYIGEHAGLTHAQARLRTDGSVSLTGHGEARRNPHDPDVPEIGDELAVTRALNDLARCLLDTTVGDLEGVTHRAVHLSS